MVSKIFLFTVGYTNLKFLTPSLVVLYLSAVLYSSAVFYKRAPFIFKVEVISAVLY